MDESEIYEMASAYIEAALFTADEEIVEPKSGEFDQSPYVDRVTDDTKKTARKVCEKFYRENAADLAGYPADSAGHDLWYNRNGHGVGFWEADHCTKEEGNRLSDAARKLGTAYLLSTEENGTGSLYIARC